MPDSLALLASATLQHSSFESNNSPFTQFVSENTFNLRNRLRKYSSNVSQRKDVYVVTVYNLIYNSTRIARTLIERYYLFVCEC